MAPPKKETAIHLKNGTGEKPGRHPRQPPLPSVAWQQYVCQSCIQTWQLPTTRDQLRANEKINFFLKIIT